MDARVWGMVGQVGEFVGKGVVRPLKRMQGSCNGREKFEFNLFKPYFKKKKKYPKRLHILGRVFIAGPIMMVSQGTTLTRGQTTFAECVFYLALEHANKKNTFFLLNVATAGARYGLSSLSNNELQLYERQQSGIRKQSELAAAKKLEQQMISKPSMALTKLPRCWMYMTTNNQVSESRVSSQLL